MQVLNHEAAYELGNLKKLKKEIENKIEQVKKDIVELEEYLNSLSSFNNDIKDLPQKFYNIGLALEKVCPNGKPMDEGQFKENGEIISKCYNKIIDIIDTAKKQKIKLGIKITNLKSDLESVNAKINYYNKNS